MSQIQKRDAAVATAMFTWIASFGTLVACAGLTTYGGCYGQVPAIQGIAVGAGIGVVVAAVAATIAYFVKMDGNT